MKRAPPVLADYSVNFHIGTAPPKVELMCVLSVINKIQVVYLRTITSLRKVVWEEGRVAAGCSRHA